MNKYRLTNKIKKIGNHTLYQIEAVNDFYTVNKGDKGGYIEGERNLSQDGNCWIKPNASVYENALVCENALLDGNAVAYGNCIIKGKSCVYGKATICGNSVLMGNTDVSGDAIICNGTYMTGKIC